MAYIPHTSTGIHHAYIVLPGLSRATTSSLDISFVLKSRRVNDANFPMMGVKACGPTVPWMAAARASTAAVVR